MTDAVFVAMSLTLREMKMQCPDPLPDTYLRHVERMAKELARADWRPAPSTAMVKRWDKFIKDWSGRKSLPLLVRRSTAGRGSIITHESGRKLIPTDNSPAHWVYRAALEGTDPPKQRNFIDQIPIALAMTAEEKRRATYTKIISKMRLGNVGWSLCHIDGVKLGYGKLENFPIDELQAHFLRFLSPSNMFVAPLVQKGVGELPQVIEAVRNI